MVEKIVIKVNNLTVVYEEKPVLWNVNLEIEKGTLMAIVGPNGAGKSTFLKAMMNLVKPISGKVKFFDEDYKNQRLKIAYVPQKESIDWDFPTTVLDVVEMGRYGKLGWFKRITKNDKEIAHEALKKVGMEEFSDRQISQLSGGQQQRIFLARALAQEVEIYFLDEPFQGIDAKTEKIIVDILKKLVKEGKTVVVVHHDLNTIKEYFDYITFMNINVISSGKIGDVFTKENIEKTYKNRNSIDFINQG